MPSWKVLPAFAAWFTRTKAAAGPINVRMVHRGGANWSGQAQRGGPSCPTTQESGWPNGCVSAGLDSGLITGTAT